MVDCSHKMSHCKHSGLLSKFLNYYVRVPDCKKSFKRMFMVVARLQVVQAGKDPGTKKSVFQCP